jgi:hypothetical protein
LRFYRGKQQNLEEALEQYEEFLNWRKENNVDKIRQEIIYGGKNTPFLFPNGKKIIDLVPQIIITPNSVDRCGRPLGKFFFAFFIYF